MKRESHILTVLVIGEEPQQRKMLCWALGSQYPVLCASSVEDGLRVAESTRPDAIVLDVMSDSGKNDVAALRELRRNPATRKIPVIVLTTSDETRTPNSQGE